MKYPGLARCGPSLLLSAVVAWAFAHAGIGSIIENVELPTLTGTKHPLLGTATANVFVFFKPGQEHSRAALKQIAVLEKEISRKSVHWVAIVSDRSPKAETEADVKAAGLKMPVLIDVGDALYGKLGVALCPVVGIADKEHKLVAYLPFAKVNYAQVMRAHLQHLLGEISAQELELALKPAEAKEGGDAEVARRRLKLAEKLFQAGNYDKALESVRKSIEKQPSAASAHALLGQILAAQGRPAEALQAFEQALRLDPSNAVAQAGKRGSQPHAR